MNDEVSFLSGAQVSASLRFSEWSSCFKTVPPCHMTTTSAVNSWITGIRGVNMHHACDPRVARDVRSCPVQLRHICRLLFMRVCRRNATKREGHSRPFTPTGNIVSSRGCSRDVKVKERKIATSAQLSQSARWKRHHQYHCHCPGSQDPSSSAATTRSSLISKPHLASCMSQISHPPKSASWSCIRSSSSKRPSTRAAGHSSYAPNSTPPSKRSILQAP